MIAALKLVYFSFIGASPPFRLRVVPPRAGWPASCEMPMLGGCKISSNAPFTEAGACALELFARRAPCLPYFFSTSAGGDAVESLQRVLRFFTPRGTFMRASYLDRAYHYTIRSCFDVMCLEL